MAGTGKRNSSTDARSKTLAQLFGDKLAVTQEVLRVGKVLLSPDQHGSLAIALVEQLDEPDLFWDQRNNWTISQWLHDLVVRGAICLDDRTRSRLRAAPLRGDEQVLNNPEQGGDKPITMR